MAYLNNGVDVMCRNFHIIWIVQHAAIFKKRNHTAGNGNMGLGRVPRDPENRRAKTGQSVDDLFKLQN
jgi:hypothetical protein